MASITIRNLSDDVKRYLRMRAGFFGTSMEEEVRIILSETMAQQPLEQMMMAQLRAEAAAANGQAGA